MPIVAGDTLRVQFRGYIFDSRIIMDLSYRCNVGAPGFYGTILQELLAQVAGPGANAIMPQYLACLPPEYVLNEIRAQLIKPTRYAYVNLDTLGATGTNPASASVANDAAAIVRRTALSGRNQISTLKIGPAPDAVSVAGELQAGYLLLLNALGAATIKNLNLPVSTAQFTPCILSATGEAGVTPRDLISFFVGKYSRVNRRRTLGVGE